MCCTMGIGCLVVCSLMAMIFVFTSLSSSNLKALSPFFYFPPFNRDMYSVYHVVILKCLFLGLLGLSRLSTNLSCHGRSIGMREKLSGPLIFEKSYKMRV